MEQFKNRKDVETYFGDDQFKFIFMSDGLMQFDSLNPVFIGDELFTFSLTFFYESGRDFFAYSGFDSWFDKFQLHKVELKSKETHIVSSMYEETYIQPTF